MPIDTQSEMLISFDEAAKRVPGRPHKSQLYRWAMRGLRGGVKLEWKLCGGRRFTSVEALERFFDALTRAAGGEAPTPSPTKTRERQQDRAVAELEAEGFEVGAAN
jgi:hypothetical protein